MLTNFACAPLNRVETILLHQLHFMKVTLTRGEKKKNILETNNSADVAYLQYLASSNTTLKILVHYSILSFSFFRADWFSQHFIPETIFIQNGLLDLNVLSSAAD